MIAKKDTESWRQFVSRVAKKAGVKDQCLEAFDFEVDGGANHEEAAWQSLSDWEALEEEV